MTGEIAFMTQMVVYDNMTQIIRLNLLSVR